MSSVAKTDHLPLIDFRAFAGVACSERQAIAQQIYRASQTFGFFYCRHLAISPRLVRQMLAQSRAFFELPEAVKNQLAWRDEVSNCGYVGLGRERLNPQRVGDAKEAFNVGNDALPRVTTAAPSAVSPKNQWPAGNPCFRDTTLQFYQACATAVEQLYEALAIALQLPDDFFVIRHQQQDYTLRLLHYPPLLTTPSADAVRAGEHSDYGSLTLLFQDAVGGLEVQTTTGDWVPVAPMVDTVVVNVGDLLQRWTNDVLISATHRVRLSCESQGARSRYSIAFFCQPDDDVEVACLASCQSRDRPARYPPIRSGDYLLSRLRATY